MVIQPNSTVNLYSGVDIDMGSGVQIAFSSIANQRAYFNSKLAAPGVTCTVVKKTGRIRLEAAGSTVKNCNYLSFVNPSFDNKVIYARILDYDYINNECTEIVWQIDFWQTWMFDVDFELSGIARQYLNETDYDKSLVNPYDPDIYAFQTPEPLPSNKSLEKRVYNYLSQGPATENTYYDGEFVITSRIVRVSPATGDEVSPSEWLVGDGYSAVIFLAPIDFDALGTEAKSKWDDLVDAIELAHQGTTDIPPYPGGRVITPGSSLSTNPYSHNQEWFQSNMSRGYYIIEIPYPYAGFLSTDSGYVNYLQKLLIYLTSWGANNQILSMYSLPTKVFNQAFVSGTAMIPSWSTLATSNVFTVPNSKQRASLSEVYNPHCKKLLLHPYSYIRAESTDGTAREYKYESFGEVQVNPANGCKFKIISDLNNYPTTSIAPKKYEMNTVMDDTSESGPSASQLNDIINYNYDERIDITQYPQIPYVIDGYLAHVSASYMEQVANNTSQAQIERDHQQKYLEQVFRHQDKEALGELVGDAVNVAGGVVGGAVKGYAMGNLPGAAIGAVVGGITGAFGMSSDINKNNAILEQTRAAQDRLQAQYDMLNEASAFRSNPTKDVPRFDDTKAAFACNYYKAGTKAGTLQSIKGTPFQDIKLTHVQLRTAILEKYDEYFKTYGYNVAGMIDIPYVVHYVQGSNSNDELPHWEQVGGKDSTYVRTNDCHCTHSMLPVAVAIEGMFNSGVRMLKGETL